MLPNVLHLIANLNDIGGAQRTLATLLKAPGLKSEVEVFPRSPNLSIMQTDLVVVHAWRRSTPGVDLNVPQFLQDFQDRPVILFNHCPEGAYTGNAELVLVYSAYAAKRWYGQQRTVILPGGINLNRFLPVARSRKWTKSAIVGRLSRMDPSKVSTQTLTYWPRIDADVFLIGGAGPQFDALAKACTDPRFRFAGKILPRLTHEFLAQIDIFLYDTESHIESFGYVILEALAAGCVVVAGNRGAIPELVATGENGYLFDHPDEAVTICNRLLQDSSMCRAISMLGASSTEGFSSELMCTRFAEHVMQALHGWHR
jgi:glycosyltransferase involved in cell wall biosynthesis